MSVCFSLQLDLAWDPTSQTKGSHDPKGSKPGRRLVAADDAYDVKRVMENDQEAFKRLYDRYVGLLQFTLKQFRLSQEQVDDIVQETFLKLHRRAASIKDPKNVKAWLVVTARNMALDLKRKHSRHPHQQLEEGESIAVEDGTPDKLRREVEIALVGQLVDKIAQEPGGESFRQFYKLGWSARRIAESNGEAVSTVTTRLSRLRKKFKEELKTQIQAHREEGHE